jgi:hypothetical protein
MVIGISDRQRFIGVPSIVDRHADIILSRVCALSYVIGVASEQEGQEGDKLLRLDEDASTLSFCKNLAEERQARALARARNAQGHGKWPLSLGESCSIIRPRSMAAAYRRKSIVGLVMGKSQTAPTNSLESMALVGDGVRLISFRKRSKQTW